MKINQCITFSRRFIHFNKTAMYRVVGGLAGHEFKKEICITHEVFYFVSNISIECIHEFKKELLYTIGWW